MLPDNMRPPYRTPGLLRPTVYCKNEIFTVVKFYGFFYFGLFTGGNFCGFLTHGKVGLVEGNKFAEIINFAGFLFNRETHENFFHMKISCFTV